MNLSMRWLKEFVDIGNVAPRDFSEAMTMSGSKVELFEIEGGQIENIARKHTIDHILTGEPVFLADIERYCQAEEFNHKSRQRIGFC